MHILPSPLGGKAGAETFHISRDGAAPWALGCSCSQFDHSRSSAKTTSTTPSRLSAPFPRARRRSPSRPPTTPRSPSRMARPPSRSSSAPALDKALEIQTDYVKTGYEGFVAQSTKIGDSTPSREGRLEAVRGNYGEGREVSHFFCSAERKTPGRSAGRLAFWGGVRRFRPGSAFLSPDGPRLFAGPDRTPSLFCERGSPPKLVGMAEYPE